MSRGGAQTLVLFKPPQAILRCSHSQEPLDWVEEGEEGEAPGRGRWESRAEEGSPAAPAAPRGPGLLRSRICGAGSGSCGEQTRPPAPAAAPW